MSMPNVLQDDIKENWITARIYLNMETLKKWEKVKSTPIQTRDEEMVL